jgi:hypothetical protein
MQRYQEGLYGIEDDANVLSLRSDIHHCFNNQWFAIVPRVHQGKTGTSPTAEYVLHILQPIAVELWSSYQNILVQYLNQRSRSYLFARFALSVLLLVTPFITQNIPRYIIRAAGDAESKVELLTGPQLILRYGGVGATRSTPRKRQRGLRTVANTDGCKDSSGEESYADLYDPSFPEDVEANLRSALSRGMLESQMDSQGSQYEEFEV